MQFQLQFIVQPGENIFRVPQRLSCSNVRWWYRVCQTPTDRMKYQQVSLLPSLNHCWHNRPRGKQEIPSWTGFLIMKDCTMSWNSALYLHIILKIKDMILNSHLSKIYSPFKIPHLKIQTAPQIQDFPLLTSPSVTLYRGNVSDFQFSYLWYYVIVPFR